MKRLKEHFIYCEFIATEDSPANMRGTKYLKYYCGRAEFKPVKEVKRRDLKPLEACKRCFKSKYPVSNGLN